MGTDNESESDEKSDSFQTEEDSEYVPDEEEERKDETHKYTDVMVNGDSYDSDDYEIAHVDVKPEKTRKRKRRFTERKENVTKRLRKEDEMALYDIPSLILEQLKCDLCHEYLSFPPITRYAETGSVCGRCPALEPEKNIQPLREKNYEQIAAIVTFPCRYRGNGCPENLSMAQIPVHEQSCGFKPYFCPILPLGCCAWQGSIPELHQHFAMNHQIMLLENPVFEFDIVNNYKEHYLIPDQDELFLLRTEFNNSDQIFRSSVHLIGKPEDALLFEYQLDFTTGQDSEKKWTYPKKPVQNDINLMDRTNEGTIELPMLQAVLDDPSVIICKVHIEKLLQSLSFEDSEEENVEYFAPDLEVDETCIPSSRNKMLDDIECPVCNEYMTSPIFQCVTGHSVCGVCKPQLNECPTCRGEIANTRNFSLEKIIENFELNCKNKEEGCRFVGTSANIHKHEVDCKYKPHRCPLHEIAPCDWQGVLNKSYIHGKNAHPDKIQSNSIYETIFNPTCSRFEDFMLKSEHGQIFRIRYFYCNDTAQVSCSVQCVAPSEDLRKFMYEVSVVDCSKSGFELKSKKFCGSYFDEKDDIKFNTLWHLDMVRPFFGPNQMLKFNCVIMKV